MTPPHVSTTVHLACGVIVLMVLACALLGAVMEQDEGGSDCEVPEVDTVGSTPAEPQPTPPTLVGVFNLHPNVLNLKSGGRYVTGFLGLPDGYSVREVFVPSVKLNGVVYAETCFGVKVSDPYGDGVEMLMLKFCREDFKAILSPGNFVTIFVIGMLNDGTSFTANGEISVI